MDTRQLSTPIPWEKDDTTGTVEELPSPNNSLLTPCASETIAPDLLLTQSFTLTIDQGGGQLSTAQTNTTAELSIPREIISSSISSTIFHAELLRPIIAGTYHGTPAYLVRLQFQLEAPGSSQSWLSRIQNASISAILEDAPVSKKAESGTSRQWNRKRRTVQADSEPQHPAIVKTFPGPEGWEGPVSAAPVSTDKAFGLQAGWDGLSASASWSQSRAREELGALKVMAVRKGQQRNSLLVNVVENPIQMAGIPSYLTIPLILTHHSRRFSIRISLNTKFGFWRGKLAEMVPVLGRADEPLFFDPMVLQQMMETEQRGVGGDKVVEWRDKLEEVDIQEYSSLVGDSH
ncbi:hypothetical protein VE00_02778 [Pseudogymnoascus sp. WSF 3629]|nr:hypothetical protein VE00_02778 [Pseudogymnoascus sp. WSF 3629]